MLILEIKRNELENLEREEKGKNKFSEPNISRQQKRNMKKGSGKRQQKRKKKM